MTLKFSVGLDVSSQKVDYCISAIDHSQRVKVKSTGSVDNNKAGFAKLTKSIGRWADKDPAPVVVCMEATGVYHERLAHYLDDAGYHVSIVLANRAKKYLQSLGFKSKNDRIDAKGLAQMGAEQNLKRWARPAGVYVELRALTRQHQAVKELITAEKNRLHAEAHAADSCKAVIRQIKGHIAYLEKQAAQMAEAIEETLRSDRELSRKVANICTVRGLSTLSVATVVAETNGFQLIENYKQLVSYAGYDVVENQSGSHRGATKISKKGNSRIRRILHLPALTAMRSEGTPFKELYERVFQRSGVKMKGIVAVQKKLLLTIYYLWRSDKPYDPNHGSQGRPRPEETGKPQSQAKGSKQKNSQTQRLATQGKRMSKDNRTLPLREGKVKETKTEKT